MKKFDQIGWVFAAALVAVAFASGFAQVTEKQGVVNIGKLVVESDFGKNLKTTLDKMRDQREDMLKFLNENGVMTGEQLTQFKELSLKATRTPDDEAKLSRIKADVIDVVKRYQALLQKPNPTNEERTALGDYQQRSQQTRSLGQQWVQDFRADLADYSDQQTALSFDKAKTAVNEVAKAQGYTMVFDTRFAPYGASDITEPALAAMNAKK